MPTTDPQQIEPMEFEQSCRIDIQTHAEPFMDYVHTQFALDNPLTLTFDLLTSPKLHAERLSITIFLPTLMNE